jgi:histidine triad (HIT) family protein
MALSKQQAEEIKKQLLEQVESLPAENKEQIKQHILGLDESGLEEFLKEQSIQISKSEPPSKAQCIFCSIARNEILSYKIGENKKAVAILELNPLSKAHSIIVPFEHRPTEKIPKQALGLAREIAQKIKSKFKSLDIKIETSSFMDHSIINVIPIYKDMPLEKKKMSEKELKDIQKKLEIKRRAIKPKSKAGKGLPLVYPRIP